MMTSRSSYTLILVITALIFCKAYSIKEPVRMRLNSKIYVAGHSGLVGSALLKRLIEEGYTNIITRTRSELDLRNQAAVQEFFEREKPEFVFLAAARVGGILPNNTKRASAIRDNLIIQDNIIHASYLNNVKKLLFLGSSCIYPRECAQPIKEEYLLTGPLEITNEPYALAKIAGLKQCQAYNQQYGTTFISCMPTNLYGPRDNFDLETAHVPAALTARFVEAVENGAEEIVIWGTGKPRREFLFVEDLAEALVFLMNNYDGDIPLNIGTGQDCTIEELARLIASLVGYKGVIKFDNTKPDGTPQKLLDVSRINALGWKAQTSLEEGFARTIKWYKQHKDEVRRRVIEN
jgi:GDP-L-fucose synthase